MTGAVEISKSEAHARRAVFARFRWLWVTAGAILAAWFLLLFLENLVVSFAFQREFAGSWELRATRRLVLPIAFGALWPAAFVAAALARLGERRPSALAVLAALAGGAIGWGVSYGRHMASLAVRVPFVGLVAAMAGAVVWIFAPRLARATRRRPRLVAALGGGAAILVWLTDERILPRLYPAFHLALFGLTLAFSALVALAVRPAAGEPTRAPDILALVALSLGALALGFLPIAARLLAAADNVRIILVEHAPLEGRAVWLASALAPPPNDESPDSALSAPQAPGELPRALDWTGHDIVLLTVDALRADHLGAYGYPRPTSPNLDLLARSGVRFDAAYCPTPHTSYSVTSLMTGKYMRPLVALGLGEDSDTWAALLRRYGYRTAAFYPPAVFFIDGERFQAMHDRGLDFEYRKEEFASPSLRARQVSAYLAGIPRDTPLFLWVHFFEPHEPYVAHPEHPFGASDLDRYDSEIATADEGIGAILGAIRASRPGAVVIATADHGEEFGEHGGRYHGTTVYEEQVRVPLLVDGPGILPGAVPSVVQTIDLLPTVLSALGIPRPARLRGRDLGPLLAGKPAGERAAPGLAFAETDDYTLLAQGDSRLVCARRAGACALFDRARDPGETHDVASERANEQRELRSALVAIARAHGKFEHGEESAWPEALRRGIAGDVDAAVDVAALLDDVDGSIRVKAAEVSFDLRASSVAPAMRRALGAPPAQPQDTPASPGEDGGTADESVRRWCSLALVRIGESPSPLAESLLHAPEAAWRRAAALAFAEQGDPRGTADLAAWWSERGGVGYVRATEILAALGHIHARNAVPILARSFDDVRLRPFIADALGEIGDSTARPALLAALAAETQVTARTHEARALLRLGGASWSGTARLPRVGVTLPVPAGANRARTAGDARLRLVVLVAGEDSSSKVAVDGISLGAAEEAGSAPAFDFARSSKASSISVAVDDEAGVVALFLLPAEPVAATREPRAQ
jgi:hypothetical protein